MDRRVLARGGPCAGAQRRDRPEGMGRSAGSGPETGELARAAGAVLRHRDVLRRQSRDASQRTLRPAVFQWKPGSVGSGGNASLIFINSNLNMHRVTLSLTPSPQDIVSLRYWRIFANELSSPLQFGQA